MFKKCTAVLLALMLAVSLFPAMGVRADAGSDETYTAFFADAEWDVLKLVNIERNAAGLEPLTGFAPLQEVAGIRAGELVELYHYNRPNGDSFDTLYDEMGLKHNYAGQNYIAGSIYSAEAVMKNWMGNEGHRGNILGEDFTSVGVGYYFDANSTYRHHWTQNFLGAPIDFTDCTLVMPRGHVLPEGTPLAELDIHLVLENAADGHTHYLPLTQELVTGFTGQKGTATVYYDLLGFSGSFKISVVTAFEDVTATDYYYDPVLWALDRGITSGSSATKFAPFDACLRSQAVTFLWRAAGKPQATKKTNPFVDVKPTDYFYDAVLWAVEKGITTGADATHFEPNSTCNRSQVVTFLYRAAGKPSLTGAGNPFTDVKSTDYFYDAVLWAVKTGITNGISTTKFGPNDICNRSQVVTFLYRAYN